MGLGGYLAAKSEADHYKTEREREAREVELYPEEEEEEIIELFEPYGLDRESMEPMMIRFRQNSEKFIDFMMRFELNLELPDPNRSWISALTIGSSYFIGGVIPLLPYVFIQNTYDALYTSCLVTSLTLFCFGYLKSIYLRPKQAFIGAIQTLAIGAVAAAFSYGIVALVDNSNTENCKGRHKTSISAAVTSTSSSLTTSYNITFDLNCTADATECAGVRATFEKATEIISSVFQFKSPLLINASYNPFCSFSKDCSNEDSMAAIGQAYPTISYIMIDNTDNMTRMYPQALLKQYTKLSVQPAWAYYDINAQFNSQVNWYFVNNPDPISSNQIDFLRNVVHELIHGLGFISAWSDKFYNSLSPMIDNLNQFLAPKLLAATSRDPILGTYETPQPFWGFVEFPFDKFINTNSSSDGLLSLSAITKELNKFYNSNALFQSALDLANAWYASDAYQVASTVYQKTVTADDISVIIDNEPIVWLETSLNPYREGSTLCHVDFNIYLNTSDYLMVYMANRGMSLSYLINEYSHVPIGPKLLKIMATLGYEFNSSYNVTTIQPDLAYWSPSSTLAGSSGNPSPAMVTFTNGPAHTPISSITESNVSSSNKLIASWLLSLIIFNILIISLL
ncbi:hypothetical protein G6F22_008587 [Rhizopus arrhizus]|nr:hypothetical protein G6F22_008587 [Rhizopus arrhizus]